jgi:hypothetical protein
MAEEAAISRLYGGIHFDFGNQGGLETGICIGRAAADVQLAALEVRSTLQPWWPKPRAGRSKIRPTESSPAAAITLTTPRITNQ